MLLLVAAALAYVAIVGGPQGPSGTEGPAVGRHLPYFQLQPLTGESGWVSRDDLAGHVTLVNYWGTWCGPCRLEFPQIVALATRFAGRADFRLYAVSCGSAGSDDDLNGLEQDTRAFLTSSGVTLPTYADQHAASRRGLLIAMGEEAGPFAYPTTILLDRQGIIRGCWQGYDARAERQVASLVEELLDEPVPQNADR